MNNIWKLGHRGCKIMSFLRRFLSKLEQIDVPISTETLVTLKLCRIISSDQRKDHLSESKATVLS